MTRFWDTHCHLDGEEFDQDREEVVLRAKTAGCAKVLVPAIDYASSVRALALSRQYNGYIHAMAGLHPEEVRADWRDQLSQTHTLLTADSQRPIAIGEVGLDFYWSRDYEKEQLEAFEQQVLWSAETRLPLMIHCRKAQNEMVHILKRYAHELPGGVFHCFTGNDREAAELLQFDRFVLGIGGVSTFRKSPLAQMLAANVPLDRLVLETDAPYMAPVPMRGQRNEPAFIPHVIDKLAEAYAVAPEVIAQKTTENAARIFGLEL